MNTGLSDQAFAQLEDQVIDVVVNGDSAHEQLLSYWAFDETTFSTAQDSGPNGFDGSYIGMDASDIVTGVQGNALAFDGVNDYVQANNPIAGLQQSSISLWVKYDEVQSRVL